MTSTSSISSAVRDLPNAAIENVIFPNLSLPDLGACSRVCKVWKELAKKHISAFSHAHAFGPKEWFIYFGGHLRNVPRLPSNIAEIMNSRCPFLPEKKVSETHLLVLVPQTVEGQPLTLKTLGDLVKKPTKGNATMYQSFGPGQYIDIPVPFSHWVLLTRDVIMGSRNKIFQDQQALLEKHIVYEVPYILDATVCIFMEYVRSGTCLYSRNPCTYTLCQEKYDAKCQLAVGGFSSWGLVISHFLGEPSEQGGVAGFRKF